MRTCPRLIACALLLLVAGFALPARAAEPGITWREGSVEQALNDARDRNTLVLLDVFATWCGPCQKLDAETFNTEVAAAAVRELVTIRVDAEAGEGPAVAERFKAIAFPSVILLRPDGSEVDRIVGFVDAEDFARQIQNFVAGRETYDALLARQAASPDDLELTMQAGERAALRGDAATAERLLLRAIGTTPPGSDRHIEARTLLGRYVYLRTTRRFDAAIEQFAEIERQRPDTREATTAAIDTFIAHSRAGSADAAQQTFDRIVGAGPALDAGRVNSIAWACFRARTAMPRAIALAEQTLATTPDDGLWDTLAELRAASGDPAGAVAASREALALKPADPYYTQQLARFSSLADQASGPR
jgi:thiol-disulfide isomerase/thioredoxin